MEAGIPTLDQVRTAAPAELAVVLSGLDVEGIGDLPAHVVEAVVAATQKVASWCHGLQAVAVDRFAELTVDAMDAHVLDLAAERGVPPARVVGAPEPDAVAASSLAPLLNIAPRTMRTRLNRARLLMELPATLGHALSGRMEPWRVDGVVTAARDVSPDRLVEFEARLYASDVTTLPKPRLAERARRAAVKADPESVERAHAAAPRRRALRWAPSDLPGLMRWTLDVPDEVSRRLAGAVDALAGEYAAADARTGTRRSIEAARLDALTDLALASATVRTVVEIVLPVAGAQPASLVTRPSRDGVIRDHLGPRADDAVLVDLVRGAVTTSTLECGQVERHLGMTLGLHFETEGNPFLTLDRPPPRRSVRPGPPEPVPWSSEARTVWFVDGLTENPGTTGLLPAHVTAILDDPDTRVRVRRADPGTDDGDTVARRTYRPRAALAARVRARDGHCRFPGCSVPAARCDLDHLTPHPVGETVEANLHALCRTHHAFKHHAGWTVTMDEVDAACTWTSPTGRSHTTLPRTRRDAAA